MKVLRRLWHAFEASCFFILAFAAMVIARILEGDDHDGKWP